MKRYILAHDLGTSGDKATIFDLEGGLVASFTSAYPTRFFNGTWAEQEPEEWWRAVVVSTRRVAAAVDPAEIGAIGFSGQMMGCVCVDEAGRPLRPSLIYCDQRATAQEAELLGAVDAHEFYRITGHRASASYPAAKLMWLRDHEAGTYAATAAMLQAKDWLNFRLTGVMRSEYTDASGTGLLDLGALAWSERLVAAAGLDGEKLPALVGSTEVVGELTGAAADEL
ncbi:MAG TPA: FGGY family carbohydrate kinase, partial [Rectinemataceae bacterium]|nr:FGGY family carbohydrate kinase [Rectinemataceae bacterium]